MTVALSDGTVAKSGGKVIKNVAGYDLAKLFAGSYGTLGAILQVRCGCTRSARHGDRGRPKRRPAHRGRRLAGAVPRAAGAGVPRRPLGGRRGAVLARSGGAAAAEAAEHVSGLLAAEGRGVVEDDDGALWDAQRDAPRTAVLARCARSRASRSRPRCCWCWPGRWTRAWSARRARPVVGARRPSPAPAPSACARRSRPLPAPCWTAAATWTPGARAIPALAMLAGACASGSTPHGSAPRGCSDGASGCRSIQAGHLGRRQAAGAVADRRLRALRLLPADLPDLRAVGRGDGLAARADRADGSWREGRRAVRADGRATSTTASAAWPASPLARRACSTTS